MEFSELLQSFRENKGLKRKELADKLNVTPTWIGNLEKNRAHPPTMERCKEIAKALSLSPAETKTLIDAAMKERIPSETAEWIKMQEDDLKALLQREKQSPGGKPLSAKGSPMLKDLGGSRGKRLDDSDDKLFKIPVISWAHANQFSLIEDPFPLGMADTYIDSTYKGKNVIALKVKNNCMEPEFHEGDFIIIDTTREPKQNSFVVVKDLDAQEATFKQYKKHNGKIILHPLNPNHKDIELDHKKRYEIVGVVVEKIKKYT